MKKNLILLGMLQLIDIVLTWYIVCYKGITNEANIIIVWLMEYGGNILGLFYLKVISMIMILIFVPCGWKKMWVRYLIYFVNCVYILVCCMSFILIMYK